MSNFYKDNDDLRYYVEKYIDWDGLARLTEFDFRSRDGFETVEEALDYYKSVLEMIGAFSANEIAPHAKEIDKQHPWIKDGVVCFPEVQEKIFEQIRDLDLHGMCIPRGLGGMNCPFTLFMLSNELMARADVSVTAHYGFHGGMGMAMLLFSIMEGTTVFDAQEFDIKSTRFEQAIGEIVRGEAWGSMDITESGAGSDMAALRTVARQDEEGSWFVSGQKVFITSGHAKYHFVLARTERAAEPEDAFAGLRGLSMFFVPTYSVQENGERISHASFDSLEEKLGHHGSATVTISFDDTPAQLVGKRGEGFKYMLMLMNNARVGVGFEALGICESAFRLATDYAQERFSMGKPISHHEMIADYLDEMRTDIQGIRALAVLGAYHEEMWQKINLKVQFVTPGDTEESDLLQKKMAFHRRSSRMVTPLLKYFAAEKAVEITRRCIQILGGYGYTCEFPAEKLLRDAMVLPIYEGTSQIQALMAMKDNLLGVIKNPKGFFSRNAKTRWLSRFSRSKVARRVARLALLSDKILLFLMKRLARDKLSNTRKSFGAMKQALGDWDPKRDFSLAMLHAERLTRVLTDVAICRELLAQAETHPEREEVLLRFLERAEPRCRYLYSEITGSGDRLIRSLVPEPSDM